MKINKKSKEGINQKIAFFSMIALLLNIAMAGVLTPGGDVLRAEDDNQQMCQAAVDVVMIIDRSGSMNDDGVSPAQPLTNAQNAANSFIDNLKVGDQSALVSYASEATFPIDKELSNNHTDTQIAVNILNASGGTNIGDAIYLSNAELNSTRANSQAIKVAILLTDGRATCPYYDSEEYSMCGFVEDQEDIDYALNAANAAASAGYKIFTIGLGSDVNEIMLSNIASATGAKKDDGSPGYYHAPSSGDLESIYVEISQQLCDYGSISGYKYETDNDGNNPSIKEGWEINLSGSINATQLTDADGFYVFVGLEPGIYTITETIPVNWVQTYGPNPNVFVIDWDTVDWENHYEDVNFGNYLLECGNGIVDENNNEECDDGNTDNGDGCSATCQTECDDSDDDGICDDVDNCVNDPNPNQEDIDGDSIGDVCDNCPNISNPNQEDTDEDGTGNVCEEAPVLGSISGCKYNDLNNNTEIDEGEEKLSGWEIQLIGCPYLPLEGFLPKENIKTNPELGEVGHCVVIETTTTGEDGCYNFDDLEMGNYGVSEVTQENWTQTFPLDDTFYYFNLTSEAKTDINFLNYEELIPPECEDGETEACYNGPEGTDGVGICQAGIRTCTNGAWGECEGETIPQAEICGNGVDEDCNGSDASCGSGSGGGGGILITPPVIKITDEKADCLENGEALITWKTNTTTTNQVAYDNNSINTENLGDAPEYGYNSINEESDSMWTEHSVTITGLTDGVMYYFRPVADRNGSEEVVGEEVFCIFKEGEVKGIETPEPAPAEECNYLLEYIKLGADNNPVEVEKLERFLNEFEGENLLVNGIYEQVDFDAVSRFQEKYLGDVLAPWSHNKATGYVYITTKKKINELYCEREFPLTPEQEAEVALFSERISDILSGGAEVSDDDGEDSETGNGEDVSGKVGGVEDEVDESEDEATEDKPEAETEAEDKADETEDESEITIQDIQEEGDDANDEYAGDRYSKYLPAFMIIIIIIAGGAWYFLYRRKENKEEK